MASVPQSTGTLKPATPVVTYDMHTDTWTDRRQAAWQQAVCCEIDSLCMLGRRNGRERGTLLTEARRKTGIQNTDSLFYSTLVGDEPLSTSSS